MADWLRSVSIDVSALGVQRAWLERRQPCRGGGDVSPARSIRRRQGSSCVFSSV